MTVITKPVTEEHIKLVDITCNICGLSCYNTCDFEYLHLSASWGYGSGKDGLSWKADLCEQCADRLKGFVESIGGKVDESHEG